VINAFLFYFFCRRTQQLGTPIPSDQRKRPISGICAQQAAAAEEKLQLQSSRANKEPRLVVS